MYGERTLAHGVCRRAAANVCFCNSGTQSGPAAFGRFRSLMGEWAAARSRAFDAFGCLRSLRAHAALDGVSWVQSGLVENAVGARPHATKSAPSSTPSLGRRSRSGVRFGLLSRDVSRYAGLNSVPCRSIACMMIVSRRASAMRALRILERFAMARAQASSFRGRLQRVSITLAASYGRPPRGHAAAGSGS